MNILTLYNTIVLYGKSIERQIILTDVKIRWNNGIGSILEAVGTGVKTKNLEKGIYQCGHWNFSDLFCSTKNAFKNVYPQFSGIACYGVCDSVEQLKSKLPPEVLKGHKLYVISVVEIKREDQSPNGGWRWHKWGPYIGNHKRMEEYLYDEKEIDRVFTYHIYEVDPKDAVVT